MLIDWFTVGAQVLNFMVLVWLMKRFLYAPVLAAIAAREQRIAAELADAAAKQAEAERQRADFAQKNAAFEQQRDTLLATAVSDAQAERARLLDQGRAADAAARQRYQATLEAEQARLADAVAAQARDEVVAIARRTLADLADTSLEQRMVDLLLRRLAGLDAPNAAQLAQALAAPGAGATLRSAFTLGPEQRAALAAALAAHGLADGKLAFVEAPALVAGIELDVTGWTLAWSVDSYLAQFSASVGALMAAPDSVATPAPANAPATAPADRPIAAPTVAAGAAPALAPGPAPTAAPPSAPGPAAAQA
jgi:F-type H+-transporting ATPase subunit b